MMLLDLDEGDRQVVVLVSSLLSGVVSSKEQL